MAIQSIGISRLPVETGEKVVPRVAQLEMWRAIKTRSYHYDGIFVFGASSTGIYCRPSCPARRPKRTEVVYFPTPAEAGAAGFRPCKRCRPNDEAFVSLQKRRISDVCIYISENLDRNLDLPELAKHINLSPSHLQRLFKRILGISPRQYAEAARLKKVKLSLKRGEPVRNAIYKSGRGSTSWLYSDPLQKLGMTPSAYKNNGRGMHIYYFTTQSHLGRLLVAGTDKGICAVSLGDSDEALEAFLMDEYSAARLERDGTGKLHSWTAAVSRYIDGQEIVPIQDLPLDIQATSFQYRVWKELQSIPYGSVSTYDEIAGRISCPGGARAVANACASNRACLVIPCHRIVRKDGSPGGYRWGEERKRSLLEHERKNLERTGELPAVVGEDPRRAQSRVKTHGAGLPSTPEKTVI
jgi:AraC family transcriptional regulator, regulatory protein of adaptative response / methylated-DNA-[protein]-cysteine methyltransferase